MTDPVQRSDAHRGAHGARVLIVDDDAPTRLVVQHFLVGEGYDVQGMPDGAAALAYLEAPDAPGVDVILLDLRMPRMDGQTFAARYRRLPAPHAPLILLAAAPDGELVEATAQLGAVGFVSKPFDLDTLLEVVARCRTAASIEPSRCPPDTPPGPPSLPATTVGRRIPDARRRQLTQLRDEVVRAHETLVQLRADVDGLAAVEATRKLTAAEAKRVAFLRRESDAVQLKLKAYTAEFADLQRVGRPRA
jgi:CheY-like chemotaxis protein